MVGTIGKGRARQSLSEVPRTLDDIVLLSDLTPEQRKALVRQCAWRRYYADEQILDRDSESRDVFFIVHGSVQVVNYALSGRAISLATVEKGGHFGELSAIDGEPRSASVVAVDDSLIASLSPEAFGELLITHASVSLRVAQRLAHIIRICDDRILDLSTLGAVQRVYMELLRMAIPDPATGTSWIIYPMPTQNSIAGRASTTRETVGRVLSTLRQSGIIFRKGKSLYIQDRARLQKMVEHLGSDQSEPR